MSTAPGPCEVVLSAHATAQARLYQQLSLQDGVHIIDATAMPERDERFDTSGLALESGFALAYPWPVYFYVNRGHTALAERVTLGSRRAHADGSFEAFFSTHPLIVNALAQLDLDRRQVLYLCNPQHSDPEFLNNNAWIRPWPKDLCARYSLDAAALR